MEYTTVVTKRINSSTNGFNNSVEATMTQHSVNVNEMISKGWMPIGGITFVTVNGCWGEVCQAMLKED